MKRYEITMKLHGFDTVLVNSKYDNLGAIEKTRERITKGVFKDKGYEVNINDNALYYSNSFKATPSEDFEGKYEMTVPIAAKFTTIGEGDTIALALSDIRSRNFPFRDVRMMPVKVCYLRSDVDFEVKIKNIISDTESKDIDREFTFDLDEYSSSYVMQELRKRYENLEGYGYVRNGKVVEFNYSQIQIENELYSSIKVVIDDLGDKKDIHIALDGEMTGKLTDNIEKAINDYYHRRYQRKDKNYERDT